jgi:hypothetical protein
MLDDLKLRVLLESTSHEGQRQSVRLKLRAKQNQMMDLERNILQVCHPLIS